MREITFSVMYAVDDTNPMEFQIAHAKLKYCPKGFTITGVEFDREYTYGKTRIAFKGVENESSIRTD